ncbi:hypothetical protein LTR95_015877, partial [Oleoguttula sp. CCFEE 5521]
MRELRTVDKRKASAKAAELTNNVRQKRARLHAPIDPIPSQSTVPFGMPPTTTPAEGSNATPSIEISDADHSEDSDATATQSKDSTLARERLEC